MQVMCVVFDCILRHLPYISFSREYYGKKKKNHRMIHRLLLELHPCSLFIPVQNKFLFVHLLQHSTCDFYTWTHQNQENPCRWHILTIMLILKKIHIWEVGSGSYMPTNIVNILWKFLYTEGFKRFDINWDGRGVSEKMISTCSQKTWQILVHMI